MQADGGSGPKERTWTPVLQRLMMRAPAAFASTIQWAEGVCQAMPGGLSMPIESVPGVDSRGGPAVYVPAIKGAHPTINAGVVGFPMLGFPPAGVILNQGFCYRMA